MPNHQQSRSASTFKNASISSSAKSTRKRATKSSSSPSSKSAKKKIKVPNPPKSLVTLLQKDKSVLKYFTALQQSLGQDVNEWKDKALEYRQRLKTLEAAVSNGTCRSAVGDNDHENDKKNKGKNIVSSRNGKKNDDCKVLDLEDQNEFDFNQLDNDEHNHHESKIISKSNGQQKDIPPIQTIELNQNNSANDDDDDDDDDDDLLLELQEQFQKQSASMTDNDYLNDMGKRQDKEKESSPLLTNTTIQERCLLEMGEDEDDSSSDGGLIFSDDSRKQPKPQPSSKALNLSSDDEEEDDDDDDEDSTMAEFRFKMEQQSHKEDRGEILITVQSHLIHAFQSFQELGISLVDVYEVEKLELKSNDNIDASQSGCETKNVMIENESDDMITIEVMKRSDIDIVTTLLKTLRSLIRTPSLDMNKYIRQKNNDETILKFLSKLYQPFMTFEHIPCCYVLDFQQRAGKDSLPLELNCKDLPPHPVMIGLQSICNALIVLDTYCSSNSVFIEEKEWDALFDNELMDKEYIEEMKLGMHGRNISTYLLQSLHGEILTWADIDRSSRGTSASLKYLKNNENDDDVDQSDSDSSNIHDDGMDEKQTTTCAGENLTYSFSSKNQNRLFLLLERICHARIVSFLYQYQSDIQSAARIVIEYIIINTPSSLEEYPKYAPTMSMCVLESLLLPLSRLNKSNHFGTKISCVDLPNLYQSWFSQFLVHISNGDGLKSLLCNALSLSIFSVTKIFKERQESTDRRVREMSKIELAAFSRIQRSEKEWLHLNHNFDSGIDLLESNFESFFQRDLTSSVLSVQLHLQQSGNIDLAIELLQHFNKLAKSWDNTNESPSWELFFSILKGAVNGIQHLKWENQCLMGLNMSKVKSHMTDNIRLAFQVDMLMDVYKEWISIRDGTVTSKWMRYCGSTIIQSCLVLGDGMRAVKAAQLILPNIVADRGRNGELEYILMLSEIPVVRIINLKCRPDRWVNSITQVQRLQLFAALAVANVGLVPEDLREDNTDENIYWGQHAHSGRDCTHLEFEQRMTHNLGSGENEVSDYVSPLWRPKDLKAFDRFARDDDTMVKSSVSERACAFSHASSWYGIQNTLSDMVDQQGRQSTSRFNEMWLTNLFKISGFARGAPLAENNDMPPCPVCIVLEDDATLVDRFNERLSTLLLELPRDFHYCSIGYSRPKTAPFVPYTSQIAIPTCLWYCTGYILSLEGAKHLMNCLPVVGPVDSWIGLKMTDNWDNSFGQRIGVGNVTKALVGKDLVPCRKDLNTIMKFRAFAAITPLCSQKLKWSSSSASVDQRGAKWRNRDTDITYSGRQ